MEEDLKTDDKKEIDKIIICYSDESTKEINKGFIMNMVEDNGETSEYEFSMVHVSGKDLDAVITGILQLANKIGYFNTEVPEDEEDEE